MTIFWHHDEFHTIIYKKIGLNLQKILKNSIHNQNIHKTMNTIALLLVIFSSFIFIIVVKLETLFT